ncbi:MAG TPA: thioesterase family protein [Alphaproteobacteria bacterium]|nr:thioesterase family protein [Alphaproteobacteria bacterium]
MSSAPFSRQLRIRFSHSDPAGIVYYPNYFDMFNGLIEDWFSDGLGIDYAKQIVVHRLGLPTVHAACDFFIPSRMGDLLSMTLLVRDVGRSSLKLTIHGHVGAEERLRADLVVVLISLDTNKSTPIPDKLRSRFVDYKAAHAGWTVEAAAV